MRRCWWCEPSSIDDGFRSGAGAGSAADRAGPNRELAPAGLFLGSYIYMTPLGRPMAEGKLLRVFAPVIVFRPGRRRQSPAFLRLPPLG
jgi:hypothetical protein